ncbi:MAG: hypothetical protein IJN43_14845 [Ruminococcus sp.]|nr:hypothetical protein [Ruminococcus sp.]
MKIIIEGSKDELNNVLGSIGIPQKCILDNGDQFVFDNSVNKGHRLKISERNFGEYKAKIKETVENFSAKPDELDEALSQIDDTVEDLSKIIIEIAEHNDDFICTTCINTAKELYQIFKNLAREEDCVSLCERYLSITGRNLDE